MHPHAAASPPGAPPIRSSKLAMCTLKQERYVGHMHPHAATSPPGAPPIRSSRLAMCTLKQERQVGLVHPHAAASPPGAPPIRSSRLAMCPLKQERQRKWGVDVLIMQGPALSVARWETAAQQRFNNRTPFLPSPASPAQWPGNKALWLASARTLRFPCCMAAPRLPTWSLL